MRKNKKILKTIVIFLSAILIYILTNIVYHLLNEGFIKTIILFLNSYVYACFVATAYFLLVIFVIYIIFIFGRLKEKSISLLIFNKLSKLFFRIVLCFALFITIIGWIKIEDIKITTYNIDINKQSQKAKYIMMADIHMGSGTNSKGLKKVQNIIQKENPDAILLAGDIFDDTTSKQDINNFYDTFSTFTCPIICIDGNHEDECFYNYESIYKKLNFIVLNDTSYITKENMQVIGLLDENVEQYKNILQKENIDNNKPIIVLKHRPQKYKYIKDNADLVLSGHVHGPRFPLQKLYYSFLMDLVYGMKKIGNMIAIVTSGVSAWGEHLKISSISEVVVLYIE